MLSNEQAFALFFIPLHIAIDFIKYSCAKVFEGILLLLLSCQVKKLTDHVSFYQIVKMMQLCTFSLAVFLMVLLNFDMLMVNSETFNAELNSQNLGTAFEFKIHLDAGKEDCYYQMVESGASFYVAFHVSVYWYF